MSLGRFTAVVGLLLARRHKSGDGGGVGSRAIAVGARASGSLNM
jgi:hypothetical protein